jgi:hypothetical protein
VRSIFVGIPIVLAAAALAAAQSGRKAADHQAIAYAKRAPDDAVARLQQRIDAGEVTLPFDAARGYLPAVLDALKIPASSQGLVFSRTSLQVDRIAPWTPRALYFNDEVYVGWVQDGPIMEIASIDPTLGAVFYTLDQQAASRPTFTRQTQTCLQCHDSVPATGGVPGLIMRSVFADRYGYTVSADQGVTTDRTPLADRWGGWYVTGTLGGQPHMGNIMAPVLGHEIGDARAYLQRMMRERPVQAADLRSRFDPDPYLTPHSDAVALMVLAHQTSVHNLITFAGYEARRASYDEQLFNDTSGTAAGSRTASTTMRIENAAERLVRALLFVKEPPLVSPVAGTSGFAADFAGAGLRDRRGRSLRELDLEHRLFRYPLSYLIYSDGFNALPSTAKSHVYRRLREVLSGEDRRPEFSHLSQADRDAIREILADTKPDFTSRLLDAPPHVR